MEIHFKKAIPDCRKYGKTTGTNKKIKEYVEIRKFTEVDKSKSIITQSGKIR